MPTVPFDEKEAEGLEGEGLEGPERTGEAVGPRGTCGIACERFERTALLVYRCCGPRWQVSARSHSDGTVSAPPPPGGYRTTVTGTYGSTRPVKPNPACILSPMTTHLQRAHHGYWHPEQRPPAAVVRLKRQHLPVVQPGGQGSGVNQHLGVWGC